MSKENAPAHILSFLENSTPTKSDARNSPSLTSDTCSLEQLNAINQDKRYIHFNNTILHELMEDKNLTGSDKYLWTMLYTLSYGNNAKEITMSSRNLSKKLGLTRPTIDKSLRSLEQNSFIKKIKNKNETNSTTSTYQIRVPISYIKKAEMERDRRKEKS